MHEHDHQTWNAPFQRRALTDQRDVAYAARGTERGKHRRDPNEAAPPGRVEAQEDIRSQLYELEPATRLDANEIHAQALDLQQRAKDYGFEVESQRADLLVADIIYRRGEIVLAGRTVEAIQDWAVEHRQDYILARTYRIIAGHYFRIGDENRGIASAVECVRQLPREAPIQVQIDHTMCVGDCLANSGTLAPAVDEYVKALRLARRLGDPRWTLVAINNLLATYTEQGNYAGAGRLVEEMLQVQDRDKLKLDYCYRDTLAQVDMAKQNYEGVKELLGPLLDPDHKGHRSDPFGYVDCMLTYINAAQLSDDFQQSRLALEMVRNLEQERGVEFSPKPLLVLEAKQAAVEGNYEYAYELQCAAFEASEKSRADERDAHSRLLHSVHTTHEAQAVSERFHRLALQDPLTGLANRRFVFETLPQRLEQEQSVAVAIVDMDHFKKINDTYSHAAGDVVLKEFSAIMAQAVGMPMRAGSDGEWHAEDVDVIAAHENPSTNYAARLGGEEFLLVFAVDSLDAACAAVTDLLDTFRGHRFSGGHGLPAVTASVGLAVSGPEENADEILTRVDRLLYQAKDSGRDQVACCLNGQCPSQTEADQVGPDQAGADQTSHAPGHHC